jgi:Arc/MetJ-type ribon-helix-helix transcriptional regulator
LAVFDNAPHGKKAREIEPDASRHDAEDARIALRCNRKELQLVDSFVASGEFPTRSELMRAALHAFLRGRALSTTPTPPVDAHGYLEVPVRLKPEEYAEYEAYAHHLGNRQDVRDTLAFLIRYGADGLKVSELTKKSRAKAREAAETRTQVGELRESGEDLERKGWVGR